jgi:hypothetical protein
MIPLKYAYLVGDLIFFIPWAILFWHRKDLRKEMLVMGLFAAVASFTTAYFWTTDWWRPQTITGTRIGIEDFILGISIGGVAAVLYEEIFRKKLYRRNPQTHSESIFLLLLLTSLFFLILFWGLHFTSFFACVFAFLAISAVLIFLRRDLFICAIINGFLMTTIVLPVYYFLMIFSPGFVEKTYLFKTLSGIRITGIPIEELIFFFLFGCVTVLIYEYWWGFRLRNFPSKVHKR